MINYNKTINISIIHFIILLFFMILTIILFTKKSSQYQIDKNNKLNNKLNKYKNIIQQLQETNYNLMYKLQNITKKYQPNYFSQSIGNNNSSHTSALSPTLLNII